ncbi:MAG: SseB family protein [Dorea sp.]
MNKSVILTMLKNSKHIFVLMSNCTKMPYVKCDAETMDDEVFVFLDENDARKEAERLSESGNPVVVTKIENKGFLGFYTSLFAIGVNGLRVKMQHEDPMSIQLSELITRKKAEDQPNNPSKVENPEFHLTALYFMQILKSKQAAEKKEELKDLNEEMVAHFQKGKYLLPVAEDMKMPILKQKDGKAFQPIFTDLYEFMKFDREKKFKIMVVEVSKLPDIMAKEVDGVSVNPMGVNVILNVAKKKA